MTKMLQSLLVLMLVALWVAPLPAADREYRAVLTGKNEVPKVKTPAKGRLKLSLSRNVLAYSLDVAGLTSPTAANIHRGKPGQNGPPVAGIFGDSTMRGPFSGILSEGTLSDKSLIGELQGKTVADLIRLIDSGNAYVNVLTETHPAGEIRGEIGRKKR